MKNKHLISRSKRMLSGLLAAAMTITMLPTTAMAVENEKYPYTLFAASSEEGAITTTAYNFCINGNVCTNGTIVANGNLNVNGTKTENAGQDMIYIFDKINTKYFTTDYIDEHTEDYVLDELNININVPTEVLGETELTGNININTALKSFEDINLFGEVKNTNDSVIFSKYGDIIIDSTNVNLNGLVYAPFGDVEITAQNLNLNNVVIIADSITLDCPNVNANYSTNAGQLVGTVSEALNIPKDEWQYMKDENGNGLPDFFEDFENWEKLADTDDDGLPDSIEEYLGSDANNIDTDNDGLNDYYEIFDTYTDPTKADTDENGVDDGEEDFDGDGLTNIQEFANETYPYDNDTDFDGLSDGDEVNVYNTDTLIADTDGEGLLDGDEIVLGTDPLVQDTDADGTLDCDEKFNQTFTHKVANEDCAVTEVSVTMDCTGNINRTTTIDSVMNIDILSSEVVGLIGEPFEIETISEFDAATIAFKVDTEKLGDTEFDNLLFLWYDEENSKFVELETILDEENGIVSTVTTHFSKYMIVDSRTWYDAWRTNLDYSGGLEVMPVDTVLVIDKSGSMDYSDIDMITDAANCYIDTMKQGDRAAIVTFASSASLRYALTDNKIELSKSLSGITPGGGTNFDAAILKALSVFDDDSRTRIVIFMSDGEDSVATTTLTKIDESGVIFHTVGYGSANSTYLKDISKAGKGEYYEALYQEDLVEIYTDLSLFYNIDKTDTDGDGLYDAVETAGIRLLNGKIIYGCDPSDPDTDDDGLLDGQEIDSKPLLSPYTKETDEHVVGYYFLMESDPTRIDTDYDYYEDGNESNRKKWEATKLYDELIDDSESIYGTNPSTDTAFRLNGTLSRMPIGEGSTAVKNVYNFQRSSNFLYEHNSNYTSTFEILPEKKGVYAITVTNVSNIDDVDIKVESERKNFWGYTEITEVKQIDQEPLVGNNQVTFYYELKNLSPNVYNPVPYYIYIDNNAATSYNVLISQDNWVYMPNGAVVNYSNQNNLDVEAFFYLPDDIVKQVIENYYLMEYGETLPVLDLENKTDAQKQRLCEDYATYFLESYNYVSNNEALTAIGNLSTIASVVALAPIPGKEAVGTVATLVGFVVMVENIQQQNLVNQLSDAFYDGAYNIIMYAHTYYERDYSSYKPIIKRNSISWSAWSNGSNGYINRYAKAVFPYSLIRDSYLLSSIQPLDYYVLEKDENGEWELMPYENY